MGKLGNIIAKDLENMFSGNELEIVLDDIADEFELEATERNRKALEPNGSSRAGLGEFYAEHKSSIGLQPTRDQFYTGRASNSLTSKHDISAKKTSFYFDDPAADDYMFDNYHQQGAERVKLPICQKMVMSRLILIEK